MRAPSRSVKPAAHKKDAHRSVARLRPWHAAAALAVILVLFFRKILLGDAFFWEDFIYYYYPTKNFAAAAIAAGHFPFWNPYTFSGMPFLADIQNAVLYLPHLLLAPFAGTRLSPVLVECMVIAHFFFAGISMVALARHLKLDLIPAFASGAFFMLSGFMISHAIHQTVIASVSWLPLITLLTLRSFEDGGWHLVPAAGAALAMAVFAGFPQVFYYLFLFEGCLFLWAIAGTFRPGGPAGPALSTVARASAITAIALGLAAIQLLPTMELAPQSARAAISFEKSLEGSLSWGQLLTLLVPKFFGVSSAEGFRYWGPGPYWHYWETCIYVGIPALLLALVGLAALKGRPFFKFVAGAALLSLLIGLGDGFFLHRVLFEVLPGYAKFRNPARCTLLFSFGGSLLAGLGIQEIMTAGERGLARLRITSAVAAAAVVLPLLLVKAGLFAGSFPFLRDPRMAAMVSSESTIALLLALASGGILLLAVRGVMAPPSAVLLLVLLWFIDMYAFGFAQNNGRDNPADYFRRTDAIAQPLLEEGKEELFRINSRDGGAMLFDRNQGMIDPLFLLEGYTPLALTNVWPAVKDPEVSFDLLNVKYRIRVDQQHQTMGLERRTTYLPRVFFAGGGRVCPTRAELERYMQAPGFDYRHCVGLEESLPFALPESSASSSVPSRVASYEPNRIEAEVDAPVPGVLVFSELYYPGWTASVDGADQTVYRADGCLRSVPVPAGHHTVRLSFLPPAFVHGAWISGSTLLLGALWTGIARRRMARNKRGDS